MSVDNVYKLHCSKPTPRLNFALFCSEIVSALISTAVLYVSTEWIITNLPTLFAKFLIGGSTVDHLLPLQKTLSPVEFAQAAQLDRQLALHLFTACNWIFRIKFAYSLAIMMRGMDKEEVIVSTIVHPTIDLIFAAQLRRNAHFGLLPNDKMAYIAFGIFLVGSLIGFLYEFQRRSWIKRHPGKLYTQGFGKIVRNPHYFSDLVFFLGWLMLTGSWWPLLFVVLQIYTFSTQYIPALDKYLEENFPEFRKYKESTAKLIPFVF
jgi:protein-S-isoprenylcysteine O-methyltransferase Ste14